jgi:hypothetical protein
MASLNGVNTNATPSEEFQILPAGDYKVIIESEEVKSSKSGKGDYINFKVKVIDGPYKNRVLYTILNLWNENEKAKEIAERDLAAIKVAVGLNEIRDTSQLFNRPLLAKVGQEHSEQWGDKNVIKGWKSLTAVPTAGGNSKPSIPPTSGTTSSAPRQFESEMPDGEPVPF